MNLPPRGVFFTVIVADKPNCNNRIYPAELCRQMVEEFKRSTGLMGHLGVPTTGKVELETVSHQITNLRFDELDQKLKAEIRILNTPCGKLLNNLLNDKVDVQFRTTGVGSGKVDANGNLVINMDTYKLISIDALESGETL